jgi:TetR/AcrR family transcriptional repressor of nem operon
MGKAERTRQFIIEQAAPIFNLKGIAGTTIDDILAATKMAKGGLYGHFANKEEIAFTMVDYLLNKLITRVALLMNKETTAVGKLHAYINFYKDPLASYIEGGCPILNFGVEADDTNQLIKQKVKGLIDGGHQNMVAIINQGVANGELSASINASDFALKTFAILEGGMMIARVMESNKHMDSLIATLKADLKTYQIN